MVQFKRDPLPIDRCQKHILEILRTFKNNIIFIGETGSGKSTQIPQFCYKAGLTKNGLMAITQPRRVAAKTLAERVALEMGTQIGDLVGYKFRFENQLGKNTQIIYQTEGILLREALNDCRLRRYSVIIVDEVHERTINTDVLLYVLKQAQRERKKSKEAPLRLILMSATMNIQQLKSYLRRPQVYCIRGRQHKVQLFHGNDLKAKENDYLFNAIATVLQLHEIEPKDHGFLVFLTGQEEIETAIRVIQKTRKTENQYADITLIPLYAAIPQQQQKQVFEPVPEGHRKVVFATNIAETSITIPGIRVIIDSGKVKRRSYDPKKRMDLLQVENISRAQAIQRAGRAGREAAGKCYRLYSQEDYETFDAMQVPEFLRSNITSVLLNLINLGMCALPTLTKLIDPPDNDQLQSAVHELIQLKAIELHCDGLHVNATDEGEKLSQFPIEPAHAKILLAASKLSCLEEALTVVAFLSSEPVFQQGNHDLFCKLDDGEYGQEAEAGSSDSLTKLSTNDGDHVRLVKIFQAFQTNRQLKGKNNMEDFFVNFGLNESRMEKIGQVRKQLLQICREVGEKGKGTKMKFTSCGNNFRPLRQAIYKGLFQNVCIYDPSAKCYWLGNKPTGSIRVRIHPSSCMVNQKMQAFVFTELIHTNEVYARDICPIQKEWISENNAALNSSFKKENGGSILSGLERIQQLQLVRSSPSSSVSSSTSSNSVKRKKKGKRMLQMNENGEEKQENEDKDEKMEVGRDSATPMDVQEQMEEKMTLGGPKKSEGKWENTLMEIDNNAAPEEEEGEEKPALKKNNSTDKQQRNGVKRKCPAGDNERPVNGAKKNGNKKKSPGTSTALSPGKHLVDYVVSSDSEEEGEGEG